MSHSVSMSHLYIYAGNVAVLRYVPMFGVPVSAFSTKVYCHFVQTLHLVLKYVVCRFVQTLRLVLKYSCHSVRTLGLVLKFVQTLRLVLKYVVYHFVRTLC